MSMPWFISPLVGAAAIAAADQAIKIVVLAVQPHVTVVPGFFAISFAANPGAAFSVFRQFPRMLTVLGILILAALVGYLWETAGTASRFELTALSLLLGGAVGNLIDRLRLGYVVDYLDVFVGKYHWPTFNLADSALSIGVACLAFLALRRHRTPGSTGAGVTSRPGGP
jgi:signal peptidase II